MLCAVRGPAYHQHYNYSNILVFLWDLVVDDRGGLDDELFQGNGRHGSFLCLDNNNTFARGIEKGSHVDVTSSTCAGTACVNNNPMYRHIPSTTQTYWPFRPL